MLNRDSLLALFRRGKIFQTGTWTPDCLSPAAYDLRMAQDFAIDAEGNRFQVGDEIADIVLEPGQIALVSTMERLCIPWDIVGNMSPKFSMAKKGIMVHTGSIIDPGFGLTGKGNVWKPRPDERVHFYLANVGHKAETLRPGDKIATVQFSQVAAPRKRVELPSSRKKMQTSLFDKPKAPLSLDYFWYLKGRQAENQEKFVAIRHELSALKTDLETVRSGYQQITYFGIYVLGAALITVFATLLLNGNSENPIGADAPWWAKVFFTVAAAFLVGVPIWLIALLRWKAGNTGMNSKPPTPEEGSMKNGKSSR